MNRVIKIEVRLAQENNEYKLKFFLFGKGYKAQGDEIVASRVTSPLDEDEITTLLMSDVKPEEARALVDNMSVKISNWFLGGDLLPTLTGVIGGLSDEDQLRLIISAHSSLSTIEYDLSILPVELVKPDIDTDPYVLNPKVAAVIHLLEKGKTSTFSSSSLNYPLRVLIVRSNPPGLGLAVPEAAPIREEILALGNQIGANATQVDVLSSEDAIRKPATWSAFTDQLENAKDPYDILIYLGHGSLKPDGPRRVGALQFEAEDGGGAKDILGDELVMPLTNYPVPVVLFVACLTAAQLAAADQEKFKNLYMKRMPEWVRGSQGVAQILLNSGTGVQVAVGMRYRIEVNDAKLFLRKFFEGLLIQKTENAEAKAPVERRGNVEAAIHLARQALKNQGYPTAYSAPVIFSVEHEEPIFPFLTKKPAPLAECQEPEGEWGGRDIIWRRIQSRPWESRSQDFKNFNLEFLKEFEDAAINTAISTAPLIMPEVVPAEQPDWLVKKPGDLIRLPVRLYGSLMVNKVNKLEGQLAVDSKDVTILGAQSSQELEESGYEISFTTKGWFIDFTIKPSGKDDMKILENIRLFDVNMKLGTAFAAQYKLRISGIKVDPQMKVCPGTNAIIVPPPLSS